MKIAPTRRTTRRVSDKASIAVSPTSIFNPTGDAFCDGVRDWRAATAGFDQRSQAFGGDPWRGNSYVQLHVVRTGIDLRAVRFGHVEQCHACPIGWWPGLRARPARFLRPPPHRDARGRAGREPGAKQPSRRDLITAASELSRHVASDLRPVGMAGHDSGASLPPSRRRRVLVHAHVRSTAQDGLSPLQC